MVGGVLYLLLLVVLVGYGKTTLAGFLIFLVLLLLGRVLYRDHQQHAVVLRNEQQILEDHRAFTRRLKELDPPAAARAVEKRVTASQDFR